MHIPIAHIEPELRSKERFGAIGELLDRLVETGAVPSEADDSVFHTLSQRERVASTGIGFQLAMPHAQCDSLPDPVIAFGRSLGGITFDSLDGLPVQFVLLFIVRSFNEHLQILKDFAGKLSRHHLEAIRNSSTAQEIGAILNGTLEQR
jgi:mannitol/fructose-specific phosphotransferase system IIA component (Ntr-type)